MSLCRSSMSLSETRGGPSSAVMPANGVARFAVGRQPHHFPLITIGLKTEKLSKCAIEISHRIRKRNHQHRVEPAVVPVPDSRRFPRSAAVHDHDGGFVKSRVRIGANSVRQVMIDKSHFRFRWPELLHEFLRSAFLMPHAQKVQR